MYVCAFVCMRAMCASAHVPLCACGLSKLEGGGVGLSQSLRIEMKFVVQCVWMEKFSRHAFVSSFQVKLYTKTN